MAINKKIQPGVTVTQVQRTQSPNIFAPSLVPFVCGPAKEIVHAFDDLGSLNPKALQGPYIQLPKTITQTSFPSPRNNISEVTVENSTIRAFFDFAQEQKELKRDPGESFLIAQNKAQRACIRTIITPALGWDLNPIAGATTLNFVIDQPIRNLTTADKAVTFTSTGNAKLTAQEVCDQINTVWGVTIATPVTLTGEARPRIQILSPTYGVLSSVTIRGGGSANTIFGFNAQEERVQAAGFRGQDQNDGTTQTPYIEFYRGDYLLNAVVSTYPVGDGTHPYYGQMDEAGTLTFGKINAITFTGLGIDLRLGDYMYADGVKVKNAEVMKVEDTRFKLGTVNTVLSTYDSNGKILIAVRDQVKVNTLYDPAPFAPRYVWFEAENLTYPTAGNTAAVLTGSTAGAPATTAEALGSAVVTDFALSGLTLKYTLTIDDVEQPEKVITFTGVFAAIGDVTTYINAADSNVLAADGGGGKLRIRTVKTGKTQKIKVGFGTANTKLFFATIENTLFTGKDVEFVDQPAVLTHGVVQTFNVDVLMGDKITLEVTNDNFVTVTPITYTWGANTTYANMTALLTALNTNVAGTAPNNVIWSDPGAAGKLTVTTVTRKGKLAGVRVKNNGADNTATGVGKILLTLAESANGSNGIQGESLKFKINDRVKIFTPVFLTNSLVDAIIAINEAVGYPVASAVSGSLDKLVLTSDLKGMASKIEVIDDSVTAQANIAFGFGSGNRIALGTGRPNPDFYLDNAGSIVLGADILRHPVTGYPYDPAQAMLYVQYRGVRKDVSPLAKNPGLLALSDMTTLHTVLDPLTEENPLGLAMYLQMLNAPNVVCYGLGVDAISASEPEGTLEAYTRAAEFIESQEVWGIAPLTHSESVAQMFKVHVDNMSKPENKSERVVFVNPLVPTRKVNTTIATGLSANSIVGQQNILTIDVNPGVALLSNGINPALPIPYSAQLFMPVTIGGVTRNYNISAVNGVIITLNTTFGVTENLDAFFTTIPLSENVISESWGMFIRGPLLLIPGSGLADKQKIAETVNTKGTQYHDKRVRYLFPETIQVPIDGVVKNVAGYYAGALYTGVRAYQAPQQGLTNFKVVGPVGVVNSNGYYNRDQLDTIAGGGVWILINDGAGLPIYARQQLTTNVDTIETQEDSIVAIVDYTSKLVRNLLRRFIGTNNVTKDVEDAISTLLDGIRKYLVEDIRCLIDMRVTGIYQDPKRPDTIKVDITVTVPYPLNHIDVTIFI